MAIVLADIDCLLGPLARFIEFVLRGKNSGQLDGDTLADLRHPGWFLFLDRHRFAILA
jgi:hypothetical protein